MVLWSIAENILIKLFQEDYSLVLFTLCFSHRLELALKDAIKKVLEPVDVMSQATFIIYMQSLPRNTENQKIYSIFWKVNSKCIAPVFILWKLPACVGLITRYDFSMDRVVENFGLYLTFAILHLINNKNLHLVTVEVPSK